MRPRREDPGRDDPGRDDPGRDDTPPGPPTGPTRATAAAVMTFPPAGGAHDAIAMPQPAGLPPQRWAQSPLSLYRQQGRIYPTNCGPQGGTYQMRYNQPQTVAKLPLNRGLG